MKSCLSCLLLCVTAWLAGCGGGSAPAAGVPLALIDPVAAPATALASVRKASGPVPQNGFWWNPAESGRGYAIEVQGSQVFLGAYMYEPSGVPTWYLATLVQQADGAYAGALNRYSGGQTLLGAYKAPSAITAVAQVSLSFSSPGAGTLSLQMADGSGGRAIPIQRLGFSTPPFALPVAGFQGGLWWNPAEGGRGYFLEVQGNQAFIGSFMYDASGQPVWYLTGATIQNDDTVAGVLQQFSGGQALNGAYRPAAPQAATPGQVRLSMTSTSTAQLTLPDGRMFAIARAIAPAGDGCAGVRSGFSGNIELVAAGPGGVGGDGGGAAAGGGLGKVLGGLLRVVDLSDGSLVGEAVTDGTLGLVTVKTCQRAGPFLLTLEGREGAKYFDEGLNQLTDFGPGNVLHALVDTWDEHVGVSPLTEAAYRYAINNFKANAGQIAGGTAPLKASGGLVGLTKAQVAQANALARSEINARIASNYQVSSVKTLPTPIEATSSPGALTGSAYGRAAVLTGGLVKAANLYNPALASPALQLANDLARDLTDGRLDGFALDGSGVARTTALSYDGRLPLAFTLGGSGMEARFSAAADKKVVPVEGFLKSESIVVYGNFPPPWDGSSGMSVYSDKAVLMSNGDVQLVRYAQGLTQYNRNEPGGIERHPQFLTGAKQLLVVGDGDTYATWKSNLAVLNNGEVWTWGENLLCSLEGLADSDIKPVGDIFWPTHGYLAPYRFFNLSDITSVAGASFDYGKALYQTGYDEKNLSFVARDARGDVWIWGIDVRASYPDSVWDLKNATKGCVLRPRKLAGVTDAKAVFAGGMAQFAVDSQGRVLAWGSGPELGLGRGFREYVTTPTQVPGLTQIQAIVAVPGTERGHGIYALASDGSWFAWGYLPGGVATVPARVAGSPFLAVAANWSRSEIVYLKTDGTVEALNTRTQARTTLTVPKARHLQGSLNEVWIHGQNGDIHVYGKNYPVPTNLSSIGP